MMKYDVTEKRANEIREALVARRGKVRHQGEDIENEQKYYGMRMMIIKYFCCSLVSYPDDCLLPHRIRLPVEKSAAEILGNPDYLAMCYGGYRQDTREIQPTLEELKEDMRILSAMGVKIIRTYNASQFPHGKQSAQRPYVN